MLYFAYGSNLHLDDLARWCDEHGHVASAIGAPVPAWLPDHELVFHYRSKVRRGGAVDFRSKVGTTVPGGLFDVADSAWSMLDAKEGLGRSYDRVAVRVLTDDGRAHEACTYQVRPERREGHVRPTDEYLALVRQGVESLGHDAAYLDLAAAGAGIAPMPDALFLYGTLMRGQTRHELVQRYDPVSIEPATVGGRLLRVDWYPGLVADGAGRVTGELFRFRELDRVFAELDPYEDFEGYDALDSLYCRALAKAHSAGESVLCWTYTYLGPRGGLPVIVSGDWRER